MGGGGGGQPAEGAAEERREGRGADRAAHVAAAPQGAGGGAGARARAGGRAGMSWQFAKDVTAGTAGGIAVTMVGHPFDTLKVRLQTQSSTNPVYAGTVDCFKKTLQWEGIGGLYKGVTSPLVGQMFFRARLFGVNGQAKALLAAGPGGEGRALDRLDYFKAGAITGAASSLAEGPIDFYKSQMQVQITKMRMDKNYVPPFKTMGECVARSFRINGALAPFQGFSATVLRNTPAFSVYFGSFEIFKDTFSEQLGCARKDLPVTHIFAAGGLAGVLYWGGLYPFDIIKSTIQSDSMVPKERTFTTVPQTIGKLYADGGLIRFYRGFVPCILRSVPANGAMLLTVDIVSDILKKY